MAKKRRGYWLERKDIGPLTVVEFKTHSLRNDDDTRAIFDQLYSLVEDVKRTQLVLNFGNIDYLASLALGKLVMLNRKILVAGGRLALCNLTAPVREVLELTRLSDLFHIHGEESEVLRLFDTGPKESNGIA